jgi:hypothetical protein
MKNSITKAAKIVSNDWGNVRGLRRSDRGVNSIKVQYVLLWKYFKETLFNS